jgi:hypothetical protein
MEENDSYDPRVDAVQKVMKDSRRESARMEYHQPAMSLRDEPPHRELARYVVKCDRAAPIL